MNSHGANPVHQIISMIQWIRTSRLSINNSLSSKGGGSVLVGSTSSMCGKSTPPLSGGRPGGPNDAILPRREFIVNLLVRIHVIIVMIWWTGLAPWELKFSFPGGLTSAFLVCHARPRTFHISNARKKKCFAECEPVRVHLRRMD